MEEIEYTWEAAWQDFIMKKVDCSKLSNKDDEYNAQVVAAFSTFVEEEWKGEPILLNVKFLEENWSKISIIVGLKWAVQDGFLKANKKDGKWYFQNSDKGNKEAEEIIRKASGGKNG